MWKFGFIFTHVHVTWQKKVAVKGYPLFNGIDTSLVTILKALNKMDCFCPRYLASWSSSAWARLWYSIATWLIMHAHVGDTLLPNEIWNFTATKWNFSQNICVPKKWKKCQMNLNDYCSLQIEDVLFTKGH